MKPKHLSSIINTIVSSNETTFYGTLQDVCSKIMNKTPVNYIRITCVGASFDEIKIEFGEESTTRVEVVYHDVTIIASIASTDQKITSAHNVNKLHDSLYPICTTIHLHSRSLRNHAQHTHARLYKQIVSKLCRDLRSPIGCVSVMNSLLGETSDAQKQEKYCDNIKKSVDIMMEIINDVNDLMTIKRGNLQLTSDRVKITDIIDDTIASVRSSGAAINYDFTSGAYSEYVQCDKLRTQQIFYNYLSNAAKHSKDGKLSCSVRLSENLLTATITLVSDVVTEDIQSAIFKSYHDMDIDAFDKQSVPFTGLAQIINFYLLRRINHDVSGYPDIVPFEPRITSIPIGDGSGPYANTSIDFALKIACSLKYSLNISSSEIQYITTKCKLFLYSEETAQRLEYCSVIRKTLKINPIVCPTIEELILCLEAEIIIGKPGTSFLVIAMGMDYQSLMNAAQSTILQRPADANAGIYVVNITSGAITRSSNIIRGASSRRLSTTSTNIRIPYKILRKDVQHDIIGTIEQTLQLLLQMSGNSINLSSSSDGEGNTNQKSRVHILIVDDVPVNQQMLRMMLCNLGFIGENITDASNGLIAFDKYVACSYINVILMDSKMPIMNGHDSARKIRTYCATKNIRQPYIIGMAIMDGENNSPQTFLNQQIFNEVLPKPIMNNELTEAMERAIREL